MVRGRALWSCCLQLGTLPSAVHCAGGKPEPFDSSCWRAAEPPRRGWSGTMEEEEGEEDGTAQGQRPGSSQKNMDKKTEEPVPSASSQYPKEAVRKHHNSDRGSRGSDSSRASRKSFRLDYRLEEDVTKSKRGKDGRFVNPWPTWKSPTLPNVLKWCLMEKDNSNVPSSKQMWCIRKALKSRGWRRNL